MTRLFTLKVCRPFLHFFVLHLWCCSLEWFKKLKRNFYYFLKFNSWCHILWKSFKCLNTLPWVLEHYLVLFFDNCILCFCYFSVTLIRWMLDLLDQSLNFLILFPTPLLPLGNFQNVVSRSSFCLFIYCSLDSTCKWNHVICPSLIYTTQENTL